MAVVEGPGACIRTSVRSVHLVINSLMSNVPLAVAGQFAIIMAPDGIDIVNVAVGPLMVPDMAHHAG